MEHSANRNQSQDRHGGEGKISINEKKKTNTKVRGMLNFA